MSRLAVIALACALPAAHLGAHEARPAARTCTASQGHVPAGKIAHRPAV